MKYRLRKGEFLEYRMVERDIEEQKREKQQKHSELNTRAHATKPIKDLTMQKKWIQAAKRHDEGRIRGGISWYVLTMIGFNTGYRIGDICKMTVGQVRGHERIEIIEEKTNKLRDYLVTPPVRKALEEALKDRGKDEFLLQSRQVNRNSGKPTHVSRQRCYAIMKAIAKETGYNDHVGCHTMRKTFAWNFYQTSHDIVELQQCLNHSSPSITLRYIGIEQDTIDKTIAKMPKLY